MQGTLARISTCNYMNRFYTSDSFVDRYNVSHIDYLSLSLKSSCFELWNSFIDTYQSTIIGRIKYIGTF